MATAAPGNSTCLHQEERCQAKHDPPALRYSARNLTEKHEVLLPGQEQCLRLTSK